MSEWFKEPVLKTGDSSRAVGSNPTLSANIVPNKFIILLVNFTMEMYSSW